MTRLIYVFALMLFWAAAIAQVPGQAKTYTIASKFLKEKRLISISTPVGYKHTDKKYPVLYVLDGEWVFSFAKGLIEFMTNDFGPVPKMIVVGIPNTERGRDLRATLKPGAGYHRFLDFVEKEVYALVNKNYRTNGFNIFYGWSSGSGIAKQMLLTRSHLFDAFIESGSGIGSKTSEFLAEKMPQQKYKNKHLYVSTEDGSFRGDGLKKYKALVEKLQPKGIRYKFEILKGLSHTQVLSQGLLNGLQFVFAAFIPPTKIQQESADAIINYYKEVNKQYNYPVEIPEGIIYDAALMLTYAAKKPAEALKLVSYGMKLYPQAVSLPASLAIVYASQKKNAKAAKYYKIAYTRAAKQGMKMLNAKYKMLYEKAGGL